MDKNRLPDPLPKNKQYSPVPIEHSYDVVDEKKDKMPEVNEKEYDITSKDDIPREKFFSIKSGSSSKPDIEEYDKNKDRGSRPGSGK